jgi:hypothetical protein
VAEQHTPIRTEALDQMLPIKFLCAARQNMRNIGAIESFALHDVRLHPNRFLRRGEFHAQPEQLVIVCPLEPRVIHFA